MRERRRLTRYATEHICGYVARAGPAGHEGATWGVRTTSDAASIVRRRESNADVFVSHFTHPSIQLPFDELICFVTVFTNSVFTKRHNK